MLGPNSDVSLHFTEILKSKNRDQKTIYNTFRGCCALFYAFFRQRRSKQLYKSCMRYVGQTVRSRGLHIGRGVIEVHENAKQRMRLTSSLLDKQACSMKDLSHCKNISFRIT